jgi:maleylpyruvate isomerase
VQLYSFCFSSTSYRVRIALSLKGIEHDYVGVNLRAGEQRSESYVQLNPAKGVPVLVTDAGDEITQSMAILNYLEECFPEPALLPTDALAKARVLELCNIIACDMHPVNNLRILAYIQGELGASDEQKDAWYKHWIAEGMSAVEAQLNKHGFGDFCFGDTPTLADVCLVPQITNALRFNCDMSAYPKAMAIYQHCTALPEFERAAAANQPDMIK